MNKRIVLAISLVSVFLGASMLVWFLVRYEATALSLTYEVNPIVYSPLSGANYSWEAKAYSVRVFGISPFDGQGYVYRERIMSENRFRNTQFHNLNVSLRLGFEITNASGRVLCNKTYENRDGCDRQVTFELNPEAAKAGNTLEIRITLNLNINYNYVSGGDPKQFQLKKEWTRTLQVQNTEPERGVTFE